MACFREAAGKSGSIFSNRAGITLALALLSACVPASDPVPPDLATFLTGAWTPTGQPGSMYFYPDGTVKIILPKHAPPIRVVSEYEMFKDGKLGIAMGGVWSGPATVQIANRKRGEVRLTLPDGQPIVFHKKRP